MRQPSTITIDTRPLKRGVHEFEFVPSADSIELDPALFRDIQVDAKLQIAARGMVVSLDVTAVATLECDRTLVAFDETVSGSFEGPVVDVSALPDLVTTEDGSETESPRSTRPGVADLDSPGTSDLADGMPIVDGVIELDGAVRDTILLAIPMRRIAPDARTMELESEFGRDESEIDPRWEALRSLSDRDESNTSRD